MDRRPPAAPLPSPMAMPPDEQPAPSAPAVAAVTPSPTAGQKRPRPLTPTSSAASLATLASTTTTAAAPPLLALPPQPQPQPSSSFPFRAAGPCMRVERAYDPATGEHRCLVYRADRRAPVAKIIWTTTTTTGADDEGDDDEEEQEEEQEGVAGPAPSAAAAADAGASSATGTAEPPQHQQHQQHQHEGEERGQEMVVLGAAGKGQRRRRVAHVKSVYVHESMRGSGLGRLLFFQLFATLRRQWHGHLGLLKLEAEEDTSRHDRLVRYYQSLGFRPTPNARVLYLNHQDAYFRKVPMYREIPSLSSASAASALLGPEELDAGASFTVVVLRASNNGSGNGNGGPSLGSGGTNNGKGKEEEQRIWVLVQDAAGGVSMLESQAGRFLCAEPDGTVVADRPVLSTWELFELESYELEEEDKRTTTTTTREVFAFRTFHGQYLRIADTHPAAAASSSSPSSSPLLALTTAEEPTLWEISSSHSGNGGSGGGGSNHGSSSRSMGGGCGGGGGGPRVIEVFQGGASGCSLRKKSAQQPKQATVRAVHRKMRRINSVAFVRQMRAKWGRMDAMARFRRLLQEKRRAEGGRCPPPSSSSPSKPQPQPQPQSEPEPESEEAFLEGEGEGELSVLGAVRRLCGHLDPLQPALADRGVSYGHTLLWIAEYIRARGHPEWLQLLGVLHGLGRLAFVLFLEASRDFQSEYEDWAFGGQAWVVGCRLPPVIRYPEVNELNPDHEDPRYCASPTGMYEPHCGLDRVLLNFSGSEYLTLLLQGQPHCLPPEALAMVRYVDLDLWHTQGYYTELATPADEAMREQVKAFHQLRAEALAALPSWASGRGPPVSLERVWPYYQALLDKYLPHGLRW